jgi:hypothetical protein
VTIPAHAKTKTILPQASLFSQRAHCFFGLRSTSGEERCGTGFREALKARDCAEGFSETLISQPNDREFVA